MAKQYTSETRRLSPLARNKRRQLTGRSQASESSTVVNVSGGSAGSGDGHTHDNLADLNKLSVADGYVQVKQADETDAPVTEKAKAGYADEAGTAKTADEATHAEKADEATHADKADDATLWDGNAWAQWMNQPVRKTDDVMFGTVKSDDIRTAGSWTDGLAGSGHRMWTDVEGVSHLTIDKLTVRQTLTALELVVDKVRSTGGTVVVSAANGRVQEVTETADGQYKLVLEDHNEFQKGDLVRVAVMGANGLPRSYWVEVLDVDGLALTVDKAACGNTEPKAGDELVLMGSATDEKRQNLILISAVEDGQPRIDILNGVNKTSLDGCLRTRLGSLDGIEDEWMGDDQPQGDGLYADNVYLRGKFVLRSGEDVGVRIAATEEKIEAVADGIRQDFVEEKGYLANAAFVSGMDKWQTENEAVFYMAGAKWIWANSNIAGKQEATAKVVTDGGRKVVRLRNKWIEQKNSALLGKPEMTELADGTKEAVPVWLSFYYKCTKAGRLTIAFEGIETEGYEAFTPLSVDEDIDVTQDYEQWSGGGMWNGTGDFRLTFTGEIYLYMLILTTDRVNALSYRYRTLFEQSAKLVQIAAENFDADGNVLESSSIVTTAKYNALISEKFNEDGSLKNTAGVVTTTNFDNWVRDELTPELDSRVKTEAFAGLYASAVEADTNVVKKADISAMVTKDADGNMESSVKVKADNIVLEGAVTANGNFKVLEDGSIETENAKIGGYLYTTFKRVADSDATLQSDGSYLLGKNLYVDATATSAIEGVTVTLPTSAAYEGARVIVASNNFTGTRLSVPNATVKTADGSAILSGLFGYTGDGSLEETICQATEVELDRGAVELVLQSVWAGYDDTGGNTYSLQWVLLSSSCRNLYYTLNGVRYACRTNADA